MPSRSERLADARLYLCCGARPRAWLESALRGGVDVVQLRDKALDDAGLVAAARDFRAAADATGALFVLNDRPELVAATGADGVHVGQADAAVDAARELVGPERLVGLSTHGPAQADAAAELEIDYIAVGPVWETPTKPGRPAIGLEAVAYAAAHVTCPWFAIGGIDTDRAATVAAAGAERIVVVRAITQSDDPGRAAGRLRAVMEAPVGTA